MLTFLCPAFALISVGLAQTPPQPAQPTSPLPISTDPACNPPQAIQNCIQPAVHYFKSQFDERKTVPVSDAKWAHDMLNQCELDFSGRKCVAEFATEFGKRCLPPGNQPANPPPFHFKHSNCHAKVSNVTQGCKPNSSIWHEQCKDPMVEKLQTYLMTNPTEPGFTEQKAFQLHHELCCEIKRYDVCVSAKSATECTPTARQIFRDIMADLNVAYKCDAKTAFANLNC